MAVNQQTITKKKKAVQNGIFKAELNNFLMKELAEDGYSGVEVGGTTIDLFKSILKNLTWRDRKKNPFKSCISPRLDFLINYAILVTRKKAITRKWRVIREDEFFIKILDFVARRRKISSVTYSYMLE